MDFTYKLALIVGLIILADLGNDHLCIVIRNTGSGLEEDERKRWRRSTCFFD
jgi:hypothetical protein